MIHHSLQFSVALVEWFPGWLPCRWFKLLDSSKFLCETSEEESFSKRHQTTTTWQPAWKLFNLISVTHFSNFSDIDGECLQKLPRNISGETTRGGYHCFSVFRYNKKVILNLCLSNIIILWHRPMYPRLQVLNLCMVKFCVRHWFLVCCILFLKLHILRNTLPLG